MNAAEIERLAAMAAALRDDWRGTPPDPLYSLRRFITANLGGWQYANAAAQLAYAAALPDTKTPARVLQGSLWRQMTGNAVAPDRSPAATRKPMPVCDDCGKPWGYHEGQDHTYREDGYVVAAPDTIARARTLAFGKETTR